MIPVKGPSAIVDLRNSGSLFGLRVNTRGPLTRELIARVILSWDPAAARFSLFEMVIKTSEKKIPECSNYYTIYVIV